jgi:hypothetical protein
MTYRFDMAINFEAIPLYAPSGLHTVRLYNYLKKLWEAHPGELVTRDQLLQMMTANRIGRSEAWAALKELERVVDCISFWDSEKRTVFYAVAPMTPEEKLQRIDDAIWFESLP